MEFREVRPDEYAEAGRVTALAYREFVPDGDHAGWEEYLAEIGDVAGRADRTIVLAAVEDGRILGTATIEMDQPIGDDDVSLPPDLAMLRMLGVDPAVRGRGAGRGLVEACVELVKARGKGVFGLRTTAAMVSAQRLYGALGFVRDPSMDMSYPGVELIGYRLPLVS